MAGYNDCYLDLEHGRVRVAIGWLRGRVEGARALVVGVLAVEGAQDRDDLCGRAFDVHGRGLAPNLLVLRVGVDEGRADGRKLNTRVAVTQRGQGLFVYALVLQHHLLIEAFLFY